MRTKFFFLLGSFFMITALNGQVKFPHVASSNSGKAEHVTKFGVSDTSLDFLSLTNATVFNGQFVPRFYARRAVDNRFVLDLTASISSSRDNGSTPLMRFTVERDDTVYPNAPSGAQYPWGNAQDGLSYAVNNRPLFTWYNSSTSIMTISAQNNLGIGVNPTARLHTNGTVRFQNLATTSSNTYVLTTDSSGNVRRQLASSFGGGLSNNCNSTNYLTKKSSSGLTCSQIYDNGWNVGVGRIPYYKLDVNGTIRCTNLTTFSDEKYKKNVKNVDNALESILNLNAKKYFWNDDLVNKEDIGFSKNEQYGLIAQEVEKVMPALTYKDENGDYSINYTGLIPVLIEALKEQQNQIVELQNQLNENFIKENTDLINLNNTKIISVSPNPSSSAIEIALNIEKSVKDARLVTYDLNGKIISSLSINERKLDITRYLHKDNFGTGTYIVSLIVNGKSLDSKKIVFK
ncbi:tail fiber domain-containing protein [Seonamhaeicola marinus]|nr:tail fiber domain-containing protein [Seonamhaeicola marinus]